MITIVIKDRTGKEMLGARVDNLSELMDAMLLDDDLVSAAFMEADISAACVGDQVVITVDSEVEEDWREEEREMDKPVTCPSRHPVGRQNPLYDGSAATGWFECEVCRLQYRPLSPGQETCDMDGYVPRLSDGGEIYWHCEEDAAYMVRVPLAQGVEVLHEMSLCEDHVEEVID